MHQIFCTALGYHFCHVGWLEQALTHRSAGTHNNERLEFLGDGLLDMAIARLLFEQFPRASEGELSRLRASLVRQETLAALAEQLGLGAQLRLGSGERASGGARRPSILADALEAVLAAVWLDSNSETACALIARLYAPAIAQLHIARTPAPGVVPAIPGGAEKDSKTQLQEWLQARHHALPSYRLLRQQNSVANSAAYFRVRCTLASPVLETEGEGSTRRAAEQAAAAAALHVLHEKKPAKKQDSAAASPRRK